MDAITLLTDPAHDPRLLDSSVSDSNLGSLFDPWGDHPIGAVHAKIADIYGVRRAFVSTGGTTVANKLALYALLDPGDEVLVERDCHVSMLQTLNEIGAVPVWLLPTFDAELGTNLAATPEAVVAGLAAHPGARAAVFTSPKYFGVAGDLGGCIAACHAAGIPVLVDEAHGDCLPFHPDLPPSAAALGADLITQSTHKATEALAQGAVLLFNAPDDAVHARLCRRFLHALHGTPAISTSFNFPIVASVEEALTNLRDRGPERLGRALALAAELRAGVAAVPGLATWGGERAGGPGFRALNPLRVAVDVRELGLTGLEVEARLQADRCGDGLPPVVAELGTLTHLLFLVTYGNTRADVAVALAHLRELAAAAPPSTTVVPPPAPPRTLPRRVLAPRDAYWTIARGATERVPVAAAVGRIAGECVAVYPPGNAVLVHGEEVTSEAVAYLRAAADLGAHLKGAGDPRFRTVEVIA